MFRNPKMLLITGVIGALIACGTSLSSADAVALTAGTNSTHVRTVDINDLKTKDSLVAITPRDQALVNNYLKTAIPTPERGPNIYRKLGDFNTAKNDLRDFFSLPTGIPVVPRPQPNIQVFTVDLDLNTTVLARNISGTNEPTLEIQDKTNPRRTVPLYKVRYVFPPGVLSNSIQAQGSTLNGEFSQFPVQLQQAQMQIEDRQYDEAIATASAFIESNPQSATGYFMRGFAYMGLQDVNSSIADFEKSASISESEGKPEEAKETREMIEELQGPKF
jgi:tetratricopeptide (TPR) repeat protein